MVAYSFQPRFIDAIAAGAKRQTIRAERKRHARPSDELQLFTGMRTRHCRLIGRATCVAVEPIRLHLREAFIDIGRGGLSSDKGRDTFARMDGFADWAALVDFWFEHHPGVDPFSGVLIRWGELVAAAPEEVPFR